MARQQFAPFLPDGCEARRTTEGGPITATLWLKQEAGVKLVHANVAADGQALILVFEDIPELPPLREELLDPEPPRRWWQRR